MTTTFNSTVWKAKDKEATQRRRSLGRYCREAGRMSA